MYVQVYSAVSSVRILTQTLRAMLYNLAMLFLRPQVSSPAPLLHHLRGLYSP